MNWEWMSTVLIDGLGDRPLYKLLKHYKIKILRKSADNLLVHLLSVLFQPQRMIR